MIKEGYRPFIHIISQLYLKHGFREYPLCKYEQEAIDVKAILNYYATRILHIKTGDRS